MTYELWNTRTGNAIGEFATKADALLSVRSMIERRGRGYADRLVLGCEDERGRSREIAGGQELAELALATDRKLAATT